MSSFSAFLAALALLFGGATGGAPAESSSGKYPGAKYASVSAKDGVLKKGCANYWYRYVIHPTTEIWALETFLVDKRGNTVASGGMLSGSDPEKGRAKFRFCRANTVPGTFTIKGKYTYKENSLDDPHEGAIKPFRYTLKVKR